MAECCPPVGHLIVTVGERPHNVVVRVTSTQVGSQPSLDFVKSPRDAGLSALDPDRRRAAGSTLLHRVQNAFGASVAADESALNRWSKVSRAIGVPVAKESNGQWRCEAGNPVGAFPQRAAYTQD